MRTALVTGAAGQDGTYLTELLAAREYRVVGVARDGTAPPAAVGSGVSFVSCDLGDPGAVTALVERVAPHEIYNLAALSFGPASADRPLDTERVNGRVPLHLLEAIRRTDRKIRFFQASSSEMFGDPREVPQREDTPLWPRRPYGAAKTFAHHMIGHYREAHGLFACSGILFNHESPRRGPQFVTRKVTRAAAAIRQGREHELRLGNLESRRDWGFAGDFVRAMWLMLRADEPGDYVVATGVTHSVRDLCRIAFDRLGLDYERHVVEAPELFRPAEERLVVGDATKAATRLGWRPEVGFEQLVHMMVDADAAVAASAHRNSAGVS